jgi:hypothetical protein
MSGNSLSSGSITTLIVIPATSAVAGIGNAMGDGAASGSVSTFVTDPDPSLNGLCGHTASDSWGGPGIDRN